MLSLILIKLSTMNLSSRLALTCRDAMSEQLRELGSADDALLSPWEWAAVGGAGGIVLGIGLTVLTVWAQAEVR